MFGASTKVFIVVIGLIAWGQCITSAGNINIWCHQQWEGCILMLWFCNHKICLTYHWSVPLMGLIESTDLLLSSLRTCCMWWKCMVSYKISCTFHWRFRFEWVYLSIFSHFHLLIPTWKRESCACSFWINEKRVRIISTFFC